MKVFFLTCILLLMSSINYAADVGHQDLAAEYHIVNAYIKPPIPGGQATAAYFTLHNNSSEAITIAGAKSPMADRLELHQHSMQDGLMKMSKVASITVNPSASLTFKPGGYHIMWFGASKLLDKKTVPLELILSNGETIKIIAELGGDRQTAFHHH